MADFDIETTISDVKLFIEKLKSDLPEVFKDEPRASEKDGRAADASVAPVCGKVLYQGKLLNCQVSLERALKEPLIIQEGEELKITINDESVSLPDLVENWIREQAKKILPVKVRETAQKMGVSYNNIVIKDQKTMWASCSSKNNLNFSYRILKTPSIVQDYLIVHELAHLLHFNHGAEFWGEVEKYIPSYKEQRKWLNANRYAVMAPLDIKYEPLKEEGHSDA